MYFRFLFFLGGGGGGEKFKLFWFWNILDVSIHTIRKNTDALLIASKEIGLEVNAEKTKKW